MKNNRSQILVNPKFQYKYVVMTAGFAFFTSLAIGALSYFVFRDVMVTFLNQYHQHTPELISNLNATLQSAGIKLGLALVSFVAVMGYIAVRVTHKASGPIYKLINVIDEIKETGEFDRTVNFREYDDFKELEVSFNELLKSIHEKDNLRNSKNAS